MTFFFEDSAAVQRLCSDAAELDRARTPFRKFSEAPGRTGGMSCVGCLKYLMLRRGAIRDVQIPDTAADYENHAFGDRFLNFMRGEVENDDSKYIASRFAEIRMPDLREMNPVRGLLMPGDIVVLQHKHLTHLPVVLNGELPFQIISALPRIGVKIGTLQDTTFRQHFKTLFRARALVGTDCQAVRGAPSGRALP